MNEPSKEITEHIDAHSFPDLDTVVLCALELFTKVALPALPRERLDKMLVLGSGNAATVGRILFEGHGAWYADESTYQQALVRHKGEISSAVIVSASGGKDAVRIAQALSDAYVPTWLLTNNKIAPASEYIGSSYVIVFPRNPEPYTYNVSTYLGMLFSYTREDPAAISRFIGGTVAREVPDTLGRFDAFYFILPARFILMKDMFLTKFDELFGALVSARAFTLAQSKHAKTLVPSSTECFISFGEENTLFGNEENRFCVSLPEDAGSAAMMAIGYYVIGQIQKQHPPYFKDHIERYAKRASALFNETITSVVE